jgi:hypothetical protein
MPRDHRKLSAFSLADDLSRRLGFLDAIGAERLTTDGNRVAGTLGALRRSLRNK